MRMFFLRIWHKVECLHHILTAGLQRLVVGESEGTMARSLMTIRQGL